MLDPFRLARHHQ